MIAFFKGQPTEYVIKHAGGKISKEGQGISFFYWMPTTTITVVSTTTVDTNFIFNEITQTFQEVTIQGQLTYRVVDPKKLSSILDFGIQPVSRKYLSQDPEKLVTRTVNSVQMATRGEIQKYSLEDTLRQSETIAKIVLSKIKEDGALKDLGVEVASIYFTAIKPTPELAKALEAEYRETVQKRADEAIYSRRAAAVEKERKIKENELASSISLEKSRKELVEINGNNRIKESEFKSKAMDIELEPFKHIDPKLLLTLGLKNLGDNAERIGNLTITPELLAGIINYDGAKKSP